MLPVAMQKRFALVAGIAVASRHGGCGHQNDDAEPEKPHTDNPIVHWGSIAGLY
jgi:hypothetical protein